jgi:hypothetical protein
MKILTDKQVTLLKKNKHVYLNAQVLTGVPFQAIMAVHFRENSLNPANPSRIGGPFQFDPPLNESQMRSLLKRFTNIGKKTEIDRLINLGMNNFESAAIFAACWMRHKSKPVLNPHSPDADIKDAFWGYNGRSYGSADKSPYVMNMYDANHVNMRIRGTVPDENNPNIRIQINKVDGRPGAFTIYKEIKSLGL